MNAGGMSLADFRESIADLGKRAATDSVSDRERVDRARQKFLEKIDRRMAVDLETCIHCGMCAEACHFYEATENEDYAPVYKFEPLRRVYRRELSPLRWFFRPFTRDLDMQQLEKWQSLVFEACTGCGRCDMMCPMGISLSPLIRVMREGLAAAGMVPAELKALDEEQREKGTVFGVGAEQFAERVAALKSQGVDIPLDLAQADVLVLTTAVEVLLFPASLSAMAKIMNSLDQTWTMLSDVFDATNVGFVAGDDTAQRKASAEIVARARACGASKLVVPESGHAYQALRWDGANQVGGELPFEVLALSEFLASEAEAGRLKLKPPANGQSVTYHDPCRLGRQSGVYEEPRRVIEALGIGNREMDSSQRENCCCGGGCGEYVIQSSAPLRQKAFAIKQREFEQAGGDMVVTSCANCRINLSIGAENAGFSKPIGGLAELVAAQLDE
jgi:Fe-S oxidoreductase